MVLARSPALCSGNSFWTTGVCPSPVDLAPLPEPGLNVIVEDLRGEDRAPEEDLVAVGGWVYFDGSCTTPSVRGLARAACSTVQTDDAGVPMKILQAAVPRRLSIRTVRKTATVTGGLPQRGQRSQWTGQKCSCAHQDLRRLGVSDVC